MAYEFLNTYTDRLHDEWKEKKEALKRYQAQYYAADRGSEQERVFKGMMHRVDIQAEMIAACLRDYLLTVLAKGKFISQRHHAARIYFQMEPQLAEAAFNTDGTLKRIKKQKQITPKTQNNEEAN